MELYTLDSLLRRVNVIDKFETLIWTERFSEIGDFELHIASTVESRSLLTPDTWLATNLSYRVMVIESVERTYNEEGSNLVVKGRSIEKFMDERLAKATASGTNTEPLWVITGTPGVIARKIFHDICVTGTLDIDDKFPFIIEGTILPTSSIPEPTDTITVQFGPQTVYQVIQDLLNVYNMGFRLCRNFDQSQIYFDIYTGSDLTSGQSVRPAVVFAPNLDNLQNISELTSIAGYKNIAYVISPVGFAQAAAEYVDPNVAGWARRVLIEQADDITDTVPATATAKMIQRGKLALSQNRNLKAFDGELNQNSNYKYGTDYQLGDLVELRNIDGVTNRMRVTEQIFVCDSQGERSYPTLTLNVFIVPGTWLAWDYNQMWQDLNASMTAWADQP